MKTGLGSRCACAGPSLGGGEVYQQVYTQFDKGPEGIRYLSIATGCVLVPGLARTAVARPSSSRL